LRAPLAVEAVLHHSQRSKLDRYRSHLFPTAYAARPDSGTGTSELAVLNPWGLHRFTGRGLPAR